MACSFLASRLRTLMYGLLLLASLLVVGCSSGSGITPEDIERLEAGQAQIRAEINADGGANVSAEISKTNAEVTALAAQLTSLSGQLADLQKFFIQNDDGSVILATATPVPTVAYQDYGFSIPFPSTVVPVTSGLVEEDASEDSGSLLASAGGVSLLLVWQTLDPPMTPQESVVGAFEILQQGTDSNFEVLAAASDAFEVDGQSATYGTFRATDDDGQVVGIALIGGWVCESTGRSFAMAVTGQQVDAVQGSFFYFTDGFGCAR
jgi:hypothetical protein